MPCPGDVLRPFGRATGLNICYTAFCGGVVPEAPPAGRLQDATAPPDAAPWFAAASLATVPAPPPAFRWLRGPDLAA